LNWDNVEHQLYSHHVLVKRKGVAVAFTINTENKHKLYCVGDDVHFFDDVGRTRWKELKRIWKLGLNKESFTKKKPQ